MMDESRVRAATTGPRVLLATLTLLTTCCGVWIFVAALPRGGGHVLPAVVLTLFVMLLAWTSFSFWMASAGFVRCLLSARSVRHERPTAQYAGIGRPVGHLDAGLQRIAAAGLRRLARDLRIIAGHRHGAAFDFFILSDTTDPDVWLAEELAWARLNQAVTGASRVYYRHRTKNVGAQSQATSPTFASAGAQPIAT